MSIPSFVNPDFPRHKYNVVRMLGEGTFGCVHMLQSLSKKQKKNKFIVEKTSDRSSSSILMSTSFVREVACLAKLNGCQNILSMISFDAEDQRIYFVTESDVMSIDLFVYLNRLQEPVHFEFLISVMFQITTGLSFMHSRGLWHRDIKSSNIILNQSGMVQIIDFGSSTIIPTWSKGTNPIYTPWYAPPEILQQISTKTNNEFETVSNRTSYDCIRADIYASGIIMWEMITNGNSSLTHELRGTTYDEQLQCIDNVLHTSLIIDDKKTTNITCRTYRRTEEKSTVITDIIIQTLHDLFLKHDHTGCNDDVLQLLVGLLHPDPSLRFLHHDIFKIINTLSDSETDYSIKGEILLYTVHDDLWHAHFDTIIYHQHNIPDQLHLSIYTEKINYHVQQWKEYLHGYEDYPSGMLSMVHTIVQSYITIDNNLDDFIVIGCIFISDIILRHNPGRSHMLFLQVYYNNIDPEFIKFAMIDIIHTLNGNLYMTTPFQYLSFMMDHDEDYSGRKQDVHSTLFNLEQAGLGWFLSIDTLVRCAIILAEDSKNTAYMYRHIPDGYHQDIDIELERFKYTKNK
jgi:serine/threonine protein kinase